MFNVGGEGVLEGMMLELKPFRAEGAGLALPLTPPAGKAREECTRCLPFCEKFVVFEPN